MSKLYNNQAVFATNFNKFLSKNNISLRKTQLNILPYILWGMITSESSVSSDIAKHLKDDFSFVQFDSVTKRIRRFFNNKLFNPYKFYDDIISVVINNYKKKHSDNNIHIIIDHMFSHNNYVVLMFSMRIGSQGIPLWFRCFKGHPDNAFNEDLIVQGINYISNLFQNKFNLIFLADRWFNSTNLMKHIESLGYQYCFRLKRNIKYLCYDKKEGHNIWKFLSNIKSYKYHSYCFKNIPLSDNRHICNIVISKYDNTSDPWILATNCDYRIAIKSYRKRFGGIESLFKNQKSNGFYIESINNSSIKSFTTMYSLVCVATLFLTILGTDYSKNTRCYKNVKIETHKVYKSKGKIRVMSLFNTGLTLFKLSVNNLKYIRIPFNFILYDI